MKKSVELEYLKKYKQDLNLLKSKLEKLRIDDDLRRKFVKSFSQLVADAIKESISEDFYFLHNGGGDRAFENLRKFFNILIEKSRTMKKRDKILFFDVAFEFYNIKMMNNPFVTEDEILKSLSKHQIDCDENIEDFILTRTGESLERLVSIFVDCFYYERLRRFDPAPNITDITPFEMDFNFKDEEFTWQSVEYDDDDDWDPVVGVDYSNDDPPTNPRPLEPGTHKIFSVGTEFKSGEFITLLFFKFLSFAYLFEMDNRTDIEDEWLESGFELLDFGFIDDFILKNVNKKITENLTCSEVELQERIRTGDFPNYLNLYQNEES